MEKESEEQKSTKEVEENIVNLNQSLPPPINEEGASMSDLNENKNEVESETQIISISHENEEEDLDHFIESEHDHVRENFFSVFQDILKYSLATDNSTQTDIVKRLLAIRADLEQKATNSNEESYLYETECPLCNKFFKDVEIPNHLGDCLNDHHSKYNPPTKRRKFVSRTRNEEKEEIKVIEENDKEGEEIDATKKCCSFACSPAPSSKRKSLIIEFEDGSVKLCRFHHFKSPTDWAIIATALDHLTLKDFGEPKLCAHLGHTTTSQGVIVKHVSRKDKKTKLQLLFCTFQCFMLWSLLRSQAQWESACKDGNPDLLVINNERYPTKSFSEIKDDIERMRGPVIRISPN